MTARARAFLKGRWDESRQPVECCLRTYRNGFTFTFHDLFAHGLDQALNDADRGWRWLRQTILGR